METSLPLPPAHPGTSPDMRPAQEPPPDAPPRPDEQAKAQRLQYLFRRTSQHPHVLHKALFTYRGVPLP